MKRKVVQHGPSTLTISLPKQWIERNSVKKGDELTLKETEHAISIQTGKKPTTIKDITITGMTGHMIHKVLGAMYKSGHDDIILRYEHPRELAKVHSLLKSVFIGYEVIEETQHSIRAKNVSTSNSQEFRTLFRRLFHFVLSVAEDSLTAACHHARDSYDTLQMRDLHIDRIANFCRRIIYTQGQQEYASDIALYYIVEQIEKVADIYRDLNRHLMKADPLEDETLHLYSRTNDLLREYTDIFFSFSIGKVQEFMDNHSDFRKIADQSSGPMRPTHLLRTIGRELADTITIVIMLYLGEGHEGTA